jgi:two-component system, LytTR family, response regulator
LRPLVEPLASGSPEPFQAKTPTWESKLQKKSRRNRIDPNLREILSLLEELRSRLNYVQRLMVGTEGRFILVATNDIHWVEAEGNYIRIHHGQTSVLLRKTISSLETNLDPGKFLRISRSVIVNLDRVRELQRESHGEFRVILEGGMQLALSRHFRKHLDRVVGAAAEA